VLKGDIWEMKAFEHFCRYPLMKIKRMGSLLVGLVDD
jgi:hypothetical protein